MAPTEKGLFLGIDIGGTKLAVGAVSPTGQLVAWDRIPTQAIEGPEHVIDRIIGLTRQVVARAGLEWSHVVAAGIGAGGPLDPIAGVVREPPNLPGWVDVPVVEHLERALEIPGYLENDANAAALGEHRFGAGRGIANMVYLTISTGIGGGIIVNNRLYRGENGNAGEIGHMSLVVRGRPCKCGGRGCLEAYASGPSIAARAREAVLAGESSVLLSLAGTADAITAETVEEALRQGDPVATRIWDETTEILGAGLANVIHIFNPRRVVLGGGITNFGQLLFEPVERIALSRVMPPLASVVEIVPAELGELVGVLGAAAVALERTDALMGEVSERA